jgi:RNA polymerase sigma factor (sigma-70 family)
MARLLRVASDERLVGQVRGGSEPAFEVIYDRYHRGLLSFCRHMLGHPEEAEDALQQTFLDAHRGIIGSERAIQLRPWLYTIARNRCLSILRARRDRPTSELEDIPTEGLAAEVQRREDLREILRDLAALPEDQRAALVLAELGALPHEEIARVLDCPRDKVKALVFQARSSLQTSRDARETPCAEIREMLSSLRGGSLRRNALRRHLRDCSGCRDFQAEVKRQRSAMAAVLPVLPSLGLKDSALAAVFGSGASGAAATAGAGAGAAAGAATAATAGSTALATKAVIVALALGGGGAAGAKVVSDSDQPQPAKSVTQTTPGAGPGAPAAVESSDAADREGTRRGHTDRGREFAKTRGKGRKRGLHGTQPGKNGSAGKAQRGKSEEAATRRAARQMAKALNKAAKIPKAKLVRPKTKAKAKPVKPKPTEQPKPRPTAQPKPRSTPQARTAPEPTATPEVVATPAPTLEPTPDATTGSGRSSKG